MFGKGILTIVFLIISNVFMTLAWYGHLKFEEMGWLKKTGIFTIILLSWGLALFEYIFQVPANKMGFNENGGPFSLFQLKVIQEVITLIVFTAFALIAFKNQELKMNHLYAAICLVAAVWFVFRN
ncbi:DMT family protein [uncultured Chryseobacterium sp.]|uniref:DMT family protein n=1 Tax=uncultured Chryseobacterium sp. TaxID=259322 RepID=UPI002616347B|nr:DMT family protein [uncultured Chryseobacterium sp.]